MYIVPHSTQSNETLNTVFLSLKKLMLIVKGTASTHLSQRKVLRIILYELHGYRLSGYYVFCTRSGTIGYYKGTIRYQIAKSA